MSSAYEVFGILGTIFGFVAGVAIVVHRYNMNKEAMERPTGKILSQGETKLGEIYCEIGKLILTNQRLLYSTYNEKKYNFFLEPNDISSINKGKKGIVFKKPTLILNYTDRKKNKSKVATWIIPEEETVSFSLLPFFGKTYKNPHTVKTFSELLLNWKKNSTQSN